MNRLEQQIASLPIAEPSGELDARVFAALESCPRVLPAQQQRPGSRLAAMVTIAAACLLTGVVAGFAGARLNASTAQQPAAPGGAAALAFSHGMLQPGADSQAVSALLTAHLVDHRFDQCQRCHVASDDVAARLRELRQNARMQAAAWERDTGETFLLASHVEDARFAECRRCHVPAEQVKAL